MAARSENLASWLSEAPYTLAMSSGFFGFFAHAGHLLALEESGRAPSRLSGSSAGALVAGCYAAGLDARTIIDELLAIKRQDFWDPRPGIGLLKGGKFAAKLKELLPVKLIEDCPRPLQISVFDVARRRTAVLESGCLVTAIRASCAFPLLFHPVWHQGRPFLDGGIADPPGLCGNDAGRTLYHHLPSTRFWGKWSRKESAAPRRDDLRTLIPRDLPKVGPFRLEHARRAVDSAYDHTKRALSGGC